MKSKTRIALSVTTALMFVFLATMVYLLVEQEKCDTEQPVEDKPVVFRTDKEVYGPGEIVTFLLLNNGTDGLEYDTYLRDTLQIFSPWDEMVLKSPYVQTGGITIIQPSETFSWTWNQTYYLYVWEEGRTEPTWDYRTWTQVPSERGYIARINFNYLAEEVYFQIEK
jgi:hypothetical protein